MQTKEKPATKSLDYLINLRIIPRNIIIRCFSEKTHLTGDQSIDSRQEVFTKGVLSGYRTRKLSLPAIDSDAMSCTPPVIYDEFKLRFSQDGTDFDYLEVIHDSFNPEDSKKVKQSLDENFSKEFEISVKLQGKNYALVSSNPSLFHLVENDK